MAGQSGITLAVCSLRDAMKKDEEFDVEERISGFSLLNIKRALSRVSISDDRDDIHNVERALRCHPGQALRVLEELERRGFVSKTTKRNKWDVTALGWRLVYHWQPPRQFTPAIEREEEREACGEIFESTRCSVLRSAPDGGEMFEEAEIEVATSVTYESARVVEIDITQPDDYDEPDSAREIALSAYLTISEAKALVESLGKAIAKGQEEIARRAAKKVRQMERAEAKRADSGGLVAKKKKKETPNERRTSEPRLSHHGTGTPPKRMASGTAEPLRTPNRDATEPGRLATAVKPCSDDRSSPPDDSQARKRRREGVAATLKDLRETNRARRNPTPTAAAPVRSKAGKRGA